MADLLVSENPSPNQFVIIFGFIPAEAKNEVALTVVRLLGFQSDG